MKLIGLEEDFVTRGVLEAWLAQPRAQRDLAVKPSSEGNAGRRLLQMGSERLAAMDDAGIDMQILSLTTPGVQVCPWISRRRCRPRRTTCSRRRCGAIPTGSAVGRRWRPPLPSRPLASWSAPSPRSA